MQRIIITFILICSCCHLSATRNEKLSFTLDSLLDNRSKIFKQKEASINLQGNHGQGQEHRHVTFCL